VSQSLNYKDLGGLIGLPPATETPAAKSTAQKKETAKRAQTGRALPTRPYDPNHLRAIDAKVHLRGKRFMASDLPLDNLNAVLDLHGGILTLQPLDFGVAGGHVVSNVVIDAREKLFRTKGEMTVRNVELGKILPKLKPPQGTAGKVDVRRAMILRTASDFDMQWPGGSAFDGFHGDQDGQYPAYIPSLEAAYRVGSRVVHAIVTDWKRYETSLPAPAAKGAE
jgi:uncharacterized protein involved in outer membrane biogenesis